MTIFSFSLESMDKRYRRGYREPGSDTDAEDCNDILEPDDADVNTDFDMDDASTDLAAHEYTDADEDSTPSPLAEVDVAPVILRKDTADYASAGDCGWCRHRYYGHRRCGGRRRHLGLSPPPLWASLRWM